MKPAVARNSLIFWLLLLAMAFGQERRDPTQPSQAIQQKLTGVALTPESPRISFKVKAIVLSDRDHGMALLETANGTIKLPLHREPAVEILLDQTRYVLKDFSASSIRLERSGR